MTGTGMEKRGRAWFVYMVRCRDGSLYTGITRDLARRVEEHNHGPNGARYTRSRRPVSLVYEEEVVSRSVALKREQAIKKLPVAAKRALIGRNAGPTSGAESGRPRSGG